MSRARAGAYRVDLVARQSRLVAVAVAKDDDVLVLLDHDAGEDPAVGRGDDRADESFANLGAGVDDVEEHRVEVVAAVGGQVGPDLSSLAEESMTAGTLLVEDLLARLGNARAGTDDGGQAVDLGVQLGRGGGLDRARTDVWLDR